VLWGSTNSGNRIVENEVTGSAGMGIMIGPQVQSNNLVAQNRVHGHPWVGIVVMAGPHPHDRPRDRTLRCQASAPRERDPGYLGVRIVRFISSAQFNTTAILVEPTSWSLSLIIRNRWPSAVTS